ARRVTSVQIVTTCEGTSCATALRVEARREARTRFSPWRPRWRARAAPMPELAPVMTMVFMAAGSLFDFAARSDYFCDDHDETKSQSHNLGGLGSRPTAGSRQGRGPGK